MCGFLKNGVWLYDSVLKVLSGLCEVGVRCVEDALLEMQSAYSKWTFRDTTHSNHDQCGSGWGSG